MPSRLGRVCVCLCLVAAIPAAAAGQQMRDSGKQMTGGPLTGPPVIGAPFSAEATTRVTGAEGSERVMTARYSS
ncbi:MAG TPA: hypothetical protein VKB50_08090 [Vicinamibacterales bacterium]|nr:hypothetical protein [Vicinamibacterales bacterium]